MNVDLIKFANDSGIVGFVLLFIIGLVKQWWVMGWTYTDLKKERDDWKAAAQASTKIAADIVKLHEH